jgi:peptidoglycan hydrolase-like protein with peptidoglycan-binding domain
MQRMLYGGTSASGSYSTLRPGDTGSDVRSLQYTLYELKYYDGQITGTYDEKTTNAVRDFQDVNGLSSLDGVAGPETLRWLYSSSAEALSSEIE